MRFSRDWFLLLTLVVLAAAVIPVIIVRLQAAPVPLERDEGEYALMGQLILDGTPPYSEAANMKFPGIYYAYSVILALFGQTAAGIHMGLLAVNLLSTLFLYLLARRLLGEAGAATAGAAFVITSAGNSFLGLFGHATQFVVMFALAGTWLLLEGLRFERRTLLLWCSGLCLGLAVVVKQSGAFFALFGFLWFVCGAFRRRPVEWKRFLRECASLAAGIVLPGALALALIAHSGVSDRFWFWTVDYVRAYASEVDLGTGIESFQRTFMLIVGNNPVIWLASLAGIVAILTTESGRKTAPFLLAFSLFSFLSVCPGLNFRRHYFVQFLPATALCAGAAVRALEEAVPKVGNRSRAVQAAVLAALVAFSLTSVFSMGRALEASTPEGFSHSVYGVGQPFSESVRVGEFIRKNSKPEDRIAVLGSEPQIYFYAHRRPATEHIYMYGLMEHQPYALRMQKELIAQVEKNEPLFLVFATASVSWLPHRESEQEIFRWMRNYVRDYYKPVMVADIHADRTRWLMDKEAESFIEHFTGKVSSTQLIVYKRKAAG
jgi:4-amino-4-deoxy-L-arabinose transferase-like glycosyltransferase